jgi:hypothetical protein
MDARDLLLDQHAAMHSAAGGGSKMSAAERAFAGLSESRCASARARISTPERADAPRLRPRPAGVLTLWGRLG